MRLFTTKRMRDIFIQIAQGPVTQAALAKEMNVSTRTIRSDLKELGDMMGQHGSSLVYDRKNGFGIDILDDARYSALLEQSEKPWKEPRSAAERRNALLTLLLRQQGHVSLEELEAHWFISIYSLRNDISLLKRHFSLYQINVESEGNDSFKLTGDELAFRRCIYDHLLSTRETETDYSELFGPTRKMADVKCTLSHHLVDNHLQFSDVNLRFFTLACGISIERILRECWLLDFEFTDVDPQWKNVAGDILEELLPGTILHIPPGEIDYMAMTLSAFCSTCTDAPGAESVCDAEHAVMNHFLSYVSSVWFCDVNYDEQSRKNLLNHIRAMRVRVNNGITIINPLLAQIKRHYPLMYEMTLSAFSEMEHFFTGKISDDEIGYLVMHIGAVLEETHYQDQNTRLRVLVVSDQSIASARLVSQKIIRMYPNVVITDCISVEQYSLLPTIEDDLVIALVSLAEKNKKVIHLPPLPERSQLENLKYLLTQEQTPPDSMINYFSAEHFFIFDRSQHNKESLINALSAHLQLTGKVDASYLPSVLEREAHASTLLDEKIAIPHPMGLVALRTQVTVAVFPEGIEWDPGKTVRLIFMLAISEDAFVDSMHIYDYLTNILDDDIIDKLCQCQDFNGFISQSEKYFV